MDDLDTDPAPAAQSQPANCSPCASQVPRPLNLLLWFRFKTSPKSLACFQGDWVMGSYTNLWTHPLMRSVAEYAFRKRDLAAGRSLLDMIWNFYSCSWLLLSSVCFLLVRFEQLPSAMCFHCAFLPWSCQWTEFYRVYKKAWLCRGP